MKRALLCAIPLLFACGTPDTEGVFGQPASQGVGGGGGSGSSAHGSSSGHGQAGSTGDGPSGVSTGTGGGGGAAASAGAGGIECDVDEDGSPDPACGGEDCDDQNPDAHPGQMDFFGAPRADGSFDYDCNGVIEKQYVALDCSGALCTNQDEGIAADVDCGKEAELGSCGGIPCRFVASGKKIQACR